MRTATIRDVARLANVSTAAVSLVTNQPDTKRVSAEKKELIRKVIAQLGYQPNGSAKALSSKAARIVGLFVPMRDPIFDSTFVAEMLSGIQSSLRDAGYDLMIYSHRAKTAKVQPEQIVRSRFVDGVIFSNTRMCSQADIDRNIEEFSNTGTPFVMVNSYSGKKLIDCVGVDDAEIGRMAASYLCGKGHRRMAMLMGSRRAPISTLLAHGFRDGLQAAGVRGTSLLTGYGEYDAEVQSRVVGAWLDRPDRPTAIFCADEQMAPALYDILRLRGLNIPADVAVLGRAGLPLGAYLTPKLSTIAIPITTMGRSAADLLLSRLRGVRSHPERVVLPCSFIERDSA